ncbi:MULTISPECIES: acyl-CoA dehydrogenase family protein [unclassified Pseudofrankia]|uniref:acyl-CoA dehydrogenase family protein n=1 Tax=unclassified Pseudofrankia TaxID=2994372 RepID=UPI0008D906AD|nr:MULTISPECIES: acyl-CoA dehydrogenase family protein [unclassified Pseudofrankia]MDT3441913.1 acyl-CoA dehydrogenase family protein [Pseudofrankia sp. BMG5.37]OHV44559.1 acyl-CoA dehydrogenase [Pseudofrankia sp. BMG5.36]
MVDFAIPEEARAVRARVAGFIDSHVLPAEQRVGQEPYFDIVAELQARARAEGLWCPFVPREWGGMGLGPLANAVVQIEVGRSFSYLAAWALNCMGPQDATMMTLIEHGTPEQKEKYLRPLVAGDLRICFSMTERAAGSDATGMRTTAVRDGDTWVLDGEKWFSSNATISDLALVMARTSDEGPRQQRFTTFLVELPNPGYRIIRNIPTMDEPLRARFGDEVRSGHAEVVIDNLVVGHENVLGGVGQGFAMGQHRLGYGRLRHGMWSIAKAQAALDLAAGRALERETFGEPLADRQGVQWMLADCAEQLYVTRLMVLHLAYKMERGLDLRQENSIAKNYIAHMLHNVVDTALQIHGSLGYTLDTPLAEWYVEARQQRLVDGPDEVHRWVIGRHVLKAFRHDGTTAAATGGDLV